MQLGDIVEVRAPAGRFVADPDPSIPAVLIAGGIGVTPFISMLRGGLAATPNRTVYLFYGVRQGREHAFKAELEQLAREQPAFHLVVVYSQPGPGDVQGRDYQHAGHVSIELLRSALPTGRHRFYVCGPPSMMASLVPALLQWGVAPGDLAYEAFGPASVRSAQGQAADKRAPGVPSFAIAFRRSGRTLAWDGSDESLLDFADRHDVPVASGCRSGGCGSCEVGLLAGSVRYAKTPDHDLAPGRCLLCVGLPDGALELDA